MQQQLKARCCSTATILSLIIGPRLTDLDGRSLAKQSRALAQRITILLKPTTILLVEYPRRRCLTRLSQTRFALEHVQVQPSPMMLWAVHSWSQTAAMER